MFRPSLSLREAFRASSTGASDAVLIHDRIARDDEHELEFTNARSALSSARAQQATYWLHQWKLLEGVDEKAFVTVAVFQSFGNSRAAIQQLGRVLRYLDPQHIVEEQATVFAGRHALDDLEGRFERYRSFEQYFDQDPGKALLQEARLPSVMLKDTPEFQYLFGDFCGRLGLEDSDKPTFDDFRLPLRTTVVRPSGVLGIDAFAQRCMEAMGLEDRYEMRIIEPRTADPQNVRLIIYLTWKNSALLVRHSFPLWDLGLMAIVGVGTRYFIFDTDGLVIDFERLDLETEPPESIRRLVPRSTNVQPWRVGQASAVGLDLAETAVRSVTARMHDFSSAFFDLAQRNQALSAVRAHSRRRDRAFSRYLSISRSSVSDSGGGEGTKVSVAEYAGWAEELAAVMDSAVNASYVFDRFAQSVPAPPAADAFPLNVLFDFQQVQDDTGGADSWNRQRLESLLAAEVCVDVENDGSFRLSPPGARLAGTLKYEISGSVHRRGRYVVESRQLDEYVRNPDAPRTLSFASAINKVQALRVVPVAHALTYAKRTFYRSGIDVGLLRSGVERGTPLEYLRPSNWMAQMQSEKGRGPIGKWVTESIFGGLYAHFGLPDRGNARAAFTVRPVRQHDPDLADELDTFDLVVCDDGGQEWADFMLVSEPDKRVVFIHAKVGDSQLSLNAMQAVGRQAQAGISVLTSGTSFAERATWWTSPWSMDDGRQVTRRILKSRTGRSLPAAASAIESAVSSGVYTKELWIWVGRTLSKQSLLAELTRADGPSPRGRQMTYYLGALQTAAARGSIGMSIFCSP